MQPRPTPNHRMKRSHDMATRMRLSLGKCEGFYQQRPATPHIAGFDTGEDEKVEVEPIPIPGQALMASALWSSSVRRSSCFSVERGTQDDWPSPVPLQKEMEGGG